MEDDRIERDGALIELFEQVREARRRVDATEAAAVRFARAVGATWEDIGDALGMSRQAARRRFERVRRRQSPR